jgi:hypothetical protein
VLKLSSNGIDVYPKVLKSSCEVSECKPLLRGGGRLGCGARRARGCGGRLQRWEWSLFRSAYVFANSPEVHSHTLAACAGGRVSLFRKSRNPANSSCGRIIPPFLSLVPTCDEVAPWTVYNGMAPDARVVFTDMGQGDGGVLFLPTSMVGRCRLPLSNQR